MASTEADPGRPEVFDLDAAWTLHPQVAVRPESFGALLYHFGTRRLSFLKSPMMAEVVQGLGDHDSARSACRAAGVESTSQRSVTSTLAVLASSSMICLRVGA